MTQVRLQPTVVQNVTTYSAIVSVSNPDLKLKPGMTANVKIETGRRDAVLRAPNAALRFMPGADTLAALHAQALPASARGGKHVWTYDGTELRPVSVTTGLADAQTTESSGGGLGAGTLVVTNSSSPSTPVRPPAQSLFPMAGQNRSLGL